MSALEQGLQLVEPPAPPPAPPPQVAPVAVPGALGRALTLTSGAQQAVAADPMMALAAEAAKADMAARNQAAAGIQENMAEKAAVMATPDPPRPSIPRLTPLPAAPEPVRRDPLRVFGQFLPMVAALGAVATKQPALNALNAATAMVQAAKRNDQEETERQRQAWLDNLKSTIAGNNQMLGEYKLALEDRQATMAEKLAKIQTIAAENQDLLTLSTLRTGNLESLSKLQQMRLKGVEQLTDVALTVEKQQLEQEKFKQGQILEWARLEIENRKANNVSMGDAIGPLLVKIQQAGPEVAEGLDKVLTPGQIAALKTYMDINAGRSFANQPGQPQASGGLAATLGGGGSAPAADPAAVAQAAGAGRSGGAPTPTVTTVPESVYAARVGQAKAALGRGATREQVLAVWVQSGLPAEEFDRRVK